jgi:hypothetical protein
MSYSTAEARSQIVSDMVVAADDMSLALACLTEAYEALDEDGGDVLESHLFAPAQAGFGRLKRTLGSFTARYGLPEVAMTTPSAGVQSSDPRVYLTRAVDAIERAEQQIADLQDSMLPVDVGDPELRAGLAETRTLLADVPAQGRRLLRTVGR